MSRIFNGKEMNDPKFLEEQGVTSGTLYYYAKIKSYYTEVEKRSEPVINILELCNKSTAIKFLNEIPKKDYSTHELMKIDIPDFDKVIDFKITIKFNINIAEGFIRNKDYTYITFVYDDDDFEAFIDWLFKQNFDEQK